MLLGILKVNDVSAITDIVSHNATGRCGGFTLRREDESAILEDRGILPNLEPSAARPSRVRVRSGRCRAHIYGEILLRFLDRSSSEVMV
jgi:hypothetical protein